MTLARNIIIFTVTVSLVTFIAFFGRLPAFRNTPIGWLHSLLVVHIPSTLRKVDIKLTNGRITNGGSRLGHHLMYEKHLAVVVFFLGLVTACATLFLPAVWYLLEWHHKLLVFTLLPQPYLFLYLSATRNNEAYINTFNHAEQMRHYPYDRILYYPGNACTTCKFLKPARSKHCSICKTCVSRADHHCIWVNNCLGRGNYKWFLALLLSTTVLLAYGAYLAYIALSPLALNHYTKYERFYRSRSQATPTSSTWPSYLAVKCRRFFAYTAVYLDVGGLRAAGVGLLALLTWPLPCALLAYHIYLLWAGMTTNESGKWSDWQDDMAHGVVFLGRRSQHSMRANQPRARRPSASIRPAPSLPDTAPPEEPLTTWPLESRHVLIRTASGQPPQTLPRCIKAVAEEDVFERVWSLAAVENVYDLGFWDNVREALLH
ncbi:palmitoyltransferase swf1 [Ampelomyces quisqualis]|uniref:Palmitoyltransferase n=1 Tax=Ampelomyces quisqualis TaxID=50730 RepID=A0A6A5Q8W3_AMPQU|nr:palmitoyltransferase swf1 [Ampelomyces quisqualis]